MEKKNLIEEAIEYYWGKKCAEFNNDCFACKAWKEYNKLKNGH